MLFRVSMWHEEWIELNWCRPTLLCFIGRLVWKPYLLYQAEFFIVGKCFQIVAGTVAIAPDSGWTLMPCWRKDRKTYDKQVWLIGLWDCVMCPLNLYEYFSLSPIGFSHWMSPCVYGNMHLRWLVFVVRLAVILFLFFVLQ